MFLYLLGIVCITFYSYFWRKSDFPKIIFQTWKSKTPPKKMAYWAESWRSNNPGYEYILWDDADNRRFVEKNFKWFLPTYDGYDAEIKRADAIRYMFLYIHGGIYADLDFECLKPFDTLLEKYRDYEIILGSMDSDWSQWNISNNIPNALMISKPGCSFWLRVLERMMAKAKDGKGRPEEQTGPIVLKEVYMWSYFVSIKLLPPSAFYPISWITQRSERINTLKSDEHILTQVMKIRYPSSYAVTYWTHSW